jgi:hypothetical protein
MATNTKVTLTHSTINNGEPVQIYCTQVVVIYNKTNDSKPNANYSTTTCSRVQSLSLENPKYNLVNVKLGEGGLTFEVLQQFLKLPNIDTDPVKLEVIYGTKEALTNPTIDNFKNLKGFDGTTTSIPVTFDGSINIPFDTIDSRHAYMPNFSIMLKEVREV